MFVTVNPNYTDHAIDEIERCVERGAIGVKLLASRRADHPLLDPVASLAAEHGLPILHHIWQHRRREWPSQEISDGADLAALATGHPRATFILAHIGGGGDYMHTSRDRRLSEHLADLSGSGVDRGMLDEAITCRAATTAVGLRSHDVHRAGEASRARGHGLSAADMAAIRWENAARIFLPAVSALRERERGSA
jgi:hypothetical protein